MLLISGTSISRGTPPLTSDSRRPGLPLVAVPLRGLHKARQDGGGRRVADPVEGQFDRERPTRCIGAMVEPSEGVEMGLTELFGDPDHYVSLYA